MEERYVLNAAQQAVLDSLITSVVVEFVATTAAALNLDPKEWEFRLNERAFVKRPHDAAPEPAPQASPEL